MNLFENGFCFQMESLDGNNDGNIENDLKKRLEMLKKYALDVRFSLNEFCLIIC